jgi:hypothetical protein
LPENYPRGDWPGVGTPWALKTWTSWSRRPDLAVLYQSEGKLAESNRWRARRLVFDRKKQSDDRQRFWAEMLLGAGRAGQKKFNEAEQLWLKGYRGM